MLRLSAEALLVMVGLGVLLWPVHQRGLWILTSISFGLRFAVGIGLYVVSYYHLPIFRSLQTSEGGWTFAIDASTYEQYGRQVAAFLTEGTPRPTFPDPVAPVAWFFGRLYWLFGSGQPQALLLNAALAGACAPLAFYAGRHLGWESRPALAAALCVGFWPSTFAWSGLVMKDPLQWFGTWLIIVGAAILLGSRRLTPLSFCAAALLLALGELICSRVRAYLSPIWMVVLLVGAICFTVVNRETLFKSAGRATLFVIVLVAANVPSIETFSYVARMSEPALRFIASKLVSTSLTTPVGSPAGTGAHEPPSPLARQGSSPAACPLAFPLLYERSGFLAVGGASVTGGPLVSCKDVIEFAPLALELTFLAPAPADWIAPGATTGIGKQVAAVDALVLWLLAPGLIAGIVGSFIQPRPMKLALVLYVLLTGLAMGIAVANFGTLFRVRLLVLLPAVLVAMDGWVIILNRLHAEGWISVGTNVFRAPSTGNSENAPQKGAN